MNNFMVFGTQVTLTFISFGLLAKYYIWPKVNTMTKTNALSALVATHMFRHLGLVFFVTPQVVTNNLPLRWSHDVAYGDLLTVTLAIIAFVALKLNFKFSTFLVWLLNIVGIIDCVIAYTHGFMEKAWDLNIGSAWYIPTFIVPALIVTNILMIKVLLKNEVTPKY